MLHIPQGSRWNKRYNMFIRYKCHSTIANWTSARTFSDFTIFRQFLIFPWASNRRTWDLLESFVNSEAWIASSRCAWLIWQWCHALGLQWWEKQLVITHSGGNLIHWDLIRLSSFGFSRFKLVHVQQIHFNTICRRTRWELVRYLRCMQNFFKIWWARGFWAVRTATELLLTIVPIQVDPSAHHSPRFVNL